MLAGAQLFAQTIIPRVGITLSNSSYEPESFYEKSDKSFIAGFTAGIGYEFTLAGIVSLQPEINFIQKGQKREEIYYYEGIKSTLKFEYKYNYLEIPVLAKVKFGGLTKFYVSAGPSIGIGLGGKYNQKNLIEDNLDSEYKGDIKFKDRPEGYEGNDVFVDNKLDIGLQIGGGVMLFNRVMIDVRYGMGLSDLYEDESSKNNVLQFSVGVPLKLF